MTTSARLALFLLAAVAAACGRPNEQGLRDSFAQQLAANKFVTEFARSGDELTFSAPSIEGGTTKWRVHIDSATIEVQEDDAAPYKGRVLSSWFADGRRIEPRGSDSNLPDELISNGIAQDCWALWDKAAGQWGWE